MLLGTCWEPIENLMGAHWEQKGSKIKPPSHSRIEEADAGLSSSWLM